MQGVAQNANENKEHCGKAGLTMQQAVHKYHEGEPVHRLHIITSIPLVIITLLECYLSQMQVYAIVAIQITTHFLRI